MNAKDYRKHGTNKFLRGAKRFLSRLGFDPLGLKNIFRLTIFTNYKIFYFGIEKHYAIETARS